MVKEGGGFAATIVVLLIGGAVIWYFINQNNQQMPSQTTLPPGLSSSALPSVGPPSGAQQLEYGFMSSIPVVGSLSPLVYKASNAIATNLTLNRISTIGEYTDSSGVKHPATLAQAGIVGAYIPADSLPGLHGVGSKTITKVQVNPALQKV